MAIYTQYGRYVKAKLLKDKLEQVGTYMLFGFGNPRWDSTEPEIHQDMPTAPYNIACLSSDQAMFVDNNLQTYCDNQNASVSQLIIDGAPSSNYFVKCKELIPPFPSLWSGSGNVALVTFDNEGTDFPISQNDYYKYYIKKLENEQSEYTYLLCDYTDVATTVKIKKPTDLKDMQYFTELYLRGKAHTAGYKHIPGFLGMARCDVSFVRDLGSDESAYTGDINQFWFGDRYWEKVDPLEVDIDSDIGTGESNKIYPHHLLIACSVNPGQLCTELMVDSGISMRQFAIVNRKLPATNSSLDKTTYRVGDYIFNFGQYTDSELSLLDKNKIVDFTLPCEIDGNTYGKLSNVDNRFEYLLHDYMIGTIKTDKRQVDRFGYVVGF